MSVACKQTVKTYCIPWYVTQPIATVSVISIAPIMGSAESTMAGNCVGVTAQSVPDAELPSPPVVAASSKVVKIVLPVNGGKKFTASVDGIICEIMAPHGKKKGDTIETEVTHPGGPQIEKMHFSSIAQAPPGLVIVKSCPMIYVIGPSVDGLSAGQHCVNDVQRTALTQTANLGWYATRNES